MNIRLAKEKDVENLFQLLRGVQALHAQGRPDIFISGTNKYDRAAITEILKNPLTPVYVVVDNLDAAVGYAFCSIENQKGSQNLAEIKIFYIDDLCVAENLRGKGIGTELFNFVVEQAKKEGCYHLTLNVWHLNQSAYKFYQKLGMQPLKTTMEKIL